MQDMGLLELDLPPIDLHASTQCDIRTPEKARFLADVGFSQIVLARELTIQEIAKVRAAVPADTVIEHFIHGALCVAYSGQCNISHAHTGRSANRGDCSQACRLPYTLQDAQGRVVAFEKHLLSVKDNNQSGNLRALIDAGVRSFKIEGRYKDAPYVKNITGHYRQLLDAILDERPRTARGLQRQDQAAVHAQPGQDLPSRRDRLFLARTPGRHRRLRHAHLRRPGAGHGDAGRRQVVRDGSERRPGQQRRPELPAQA